MEKDLDVICIGRAAVDLYGQQVGGRLEEMQSFAKYLGGSSGNLAADLAIGLDDFDEAYISSSRSLSITGTHLSTPNSKAAVLQAVRFAKRNDTKVILDIDYRPVLWGLVSPGSGEERFVASDEASGSIRQLLPDCDIVVGTEEEIMIAGGAVAGAGSTIDSLRNIRSRSAAVVVVKRGAIGCSVFEGKIPADIDDGVSVPGVEVDVFNTLGAGDAFLSGFLHGWLDGASWRRCGQLGNACGALVVSRHGCTPAMPTKIELDNFMARSPVIERPDLDSEIEYLHRVGTRRKAPQQLFVLAFDQRREFEEIASGVESWNDDIRRFKEIAGKAAELVGQRRRGKAGLGVMVDGRYGNAVLSRMTNEGWWIGRPVEIPGSRPVRFEPRNNMGLPLTSWPVSHTVKCRIHYRADDPIGLRLEQEQLIRQLHADCSDLDRELLLAVTTPSGNDEGSESAVANVIRRFYNLGVPGLVDPGATDGYRMAGNRRCDP